MLKVAIDTLPLESGHAARGVGMYTRNLISQLVKKSKKDSNFILDAFNFSNSKEKLLGYDVIHYTYFDLFFHSLPLNKTTKTIVTVHDLIPLIYPQYYPPGIKGKTKLFLQKLALKKIDHIITVSETSKKDIIRIFNIDANKISIIYEAPNFKFTNFTSRANDKTVKKYNLHKQYILYVGDVNWNKNIIRLCDAAISLKKQLVIVGKQAANVAYDKEHIENRPLRKLQEKYSRSKYINILGYIEQEDLNIIWQLATVYCQPSLYEGFGLPVLEAMDAGVPVVASKTNAIKEVAGSAAIFFDPYDTLELINKLKEVLKNKKLQNNLIKKGKYRVKKFSWEKTARDTIEIYKKVNAK